MSALALKILSEGNTGDHNKLRLVSLSSYVENRYLMNIIYACVRWKRLEWIVFVCQPWPWKIHLREIRAIKRSCACFLCPVLFGITILWTYLMLVFIGNDFSELCLYVNLGKFLGILKSLLKRVCVSNDYPLRSLQWKFSEFDDVLQFHCARIVDFRPF